MAAPLSAAEVPDPTSTISAAGQGGWEIICHSIESGGEEAARILNAGRSSYASASMRHAACDVKNSSKAPLVVSIVAPAMICPFKSTDAGACEKTFAERGTGSFELKKAKAPR